MFNKAKWIWPTSQSEKHQRAEFLFRANVSEVGDEVKLNIGCETKYWLFVNEELVVFDGGLFRESLPECGYYDEVDITKHLRVGENEIKIHVWYFGNGGRNNSKCKSAGLILSCDELSLYSDENTVCQLNHAYVLPTKAQPTFLYGGNHTAYDATAKEFSLCPVIDGNAGHAVVLGAYGDEPWGKLYKRPIPMLLFSDRIPCPAEKTDDGYEISLPYAMHVSPYFKINAPAGKMIVAHSDRYAVNGGPGDHYSRYFGHRAEYTTRDGEQEFEMLDWVFGEKLIFNIPEGVEVLELGYRESRYDTKVTTTFSCNDPDLNKLFEKCVRTLKVCMRENFMDCPDRERGQWIGDVSVQAPQTVYLLDDNGLALLRKAIYDFIQLRKDDVLMGNVPGDHYSELPAQSLNAISEHGMIAAYYDRTKDKSVLELAFEPSVKYLKLWKTDAHGVVKARGGNWEWYDHLYNCDKPILNICWYYSALRFVKKMSEIIGDERYDRFIKKRMRAIERTFDKKYWNKKERCYTSGTVVDDRANAMAVLSGLCPRERYRDIRFVLTEVFNSTPYMENYVALALCEMGYKKDALTRMISRYYPLTQNENSTLWEDFYCLGTKNHAWSGGPATILLRYFAGVRPDLTIEGVNDISPLTSLSCSFINADGKRVSIEKH